MPSLMECVLENVDPDESVEEFLDSFSIDRIAVSSIDGGWERVDTDTLDPQIDGLSRDDFRKEGPAVYEVNGYMIVHGYDGARHHWFVHEQIGVGAHA